MDNDLWELAFKYMLIGLVVVGVAILLIGIAVGVSL